MNKREQEFANDVSKRLSAYLLTVPKNVKDDINILELKLLDAYKVLLEKYVELDGNIEHLEYRKVLDDYRNIIRSNISSDSERSLSSCYYVKFRTMNIPDDVIRSFLPTSINKVLTKLIHTKEERDILNKLLKEYCTGEYGYNYLRELMSYAGIIYLVVNGGPDINWEKRYNW